MTSVCVYMSVRRMVFSLSITQKNISSLFVYSFGVHRKRQQQRRMLLKLSFLVGIVYVCVRVCVMQHQTDTVIRGSNFSFSVFAGVRVLVRECVRCNDVSKRK